MKLEIPKRFRKDFEELTERKEFKEIQTVANHLNSQLEKMPVYRSFKRRKRKAINQVSKRWLRLEFIVCERSVSKGEPLPLIIKLEMVNVTCSKCGFKWRTNFDAAFLKELCPECGSYEIGIECDEQKKE